MKKIVERTCMGCNQKKEQKQLIRVVKTKNNDICIDKDKKQQGRGAYICDNIECLEKVIKSRRLERIFDMKISEEIYNDLRGVILDK